jgi:hypothetical protein
MSEHDDKTPIPLSEIKDPSLKHIVENFPEELRDTIKLTPDQVLLLMRHASEGNAYGLQNKLPLICRGDQCPYAEICVYQRMGIAPVGFGCPDEKIVIDQMVTSLVRELQVDPENAVELDMIADYIDAALQEMRAQKELAIRGQTQEVVVQIDPATGQTFTETRESAILNVKERAQRRKDSIRKSFLATREMRARYKVSEDEDRSRREAELRAKYQELAAKDPEALESAIKQLSEESDDDEL